MNQYNDSKEGRPTSTNSKGGVTDPAAESHLSGPTIAPLGGLKLGFTSSSPSSSSAASAASSSLSAAAPPPLSNPTRKEVDETQLSITDLQKKIAQCVGLSIQNRQFHVDINSAIDRNIKYHRKHMKAPDSITMADKKQFDIDSDIIMYSRLIEDGINAAPEITSAISSMVTKQTADRTQAALDSINSMMLFQSPPQKRCRKAAAVAPVEKKYKAAPAAEAEVPPPLEPAPELVESHEEQESADSDYANDDTIETQEEGVLDDPNIHAHVEGAANDSGAEVAGVEGAADGQTDMDTSA